MPPAIPMQNLPTNIAPVPVPISALAPPQSIPVKPITLRDQIAIRIKYLFKPIAAFIIYALTLYIAASAPTRYTVLGRVSAPLGTWFLTVLAKAGDIVFAFAVEDAFDTMTWRRLKQARKHSGALSFSGMRLDWLLALLSSTGVEGLVRILGREIRRVVRQDDRVDRRRVGWTAAVRLGFILALIPGPGIILMANVRQQNIFFPIRSISVTGGLGEYTPGAAQIYSKVWGPQIATLVTMMLRDRSITWPVKPISQSCKDQKSCVSYLVAGPYQTIAPWPFEEESEDINGFRLYGAPFYQVDLWNAGANLTFSESRDCKLYGGANRTSDFSMVICLQQQSDDGLIAAGWKSCQLGYTENGTCLAPASGQNDSDWSTYMQFYRRSAGITFSRLEYTIQEVFNLSDPSPYPIPPSDLFKALNNVLYRPLLATNDQRYDAKSQQYVLTQYISINIWSSLNEKSKGLNFARDWLRNLLVMPVYLFQPTILPIGAQVFSINNGTQEQPNLPPENHVEGAYCVVDNRSIPSWGTVLAYAIVGGVVLVFVGSAKAVATFWEPIDTSEFPMIDFEVLTMLADGRGKEIPPLRERFLEKDYKEGRVLDRTDDVRIGLRKP